MAANKEPIFTLTPKLGQVAVSAANTASDGSGSLATLYTAGSNGSRVDRLNYRNAQITPAASSAMVIRFFVSDTSGNNPILILEIALPAATRSASAVGAGSSYTFPNGLILPGGAIIKVCQSVYAGVQDLMHYTAEGGDY